MLQILIAGAALVSAGVNLNRGVDARILSAALEAPESKRAPREGPRYCVFDRGHDLSGNGQASSGPRRICRTQREWVALGVQPLTG